MRLKSLIRTPFRYTYFKATLIIIAVNALAYFLCNFTGLRNLAYQLVYGNQVVASYPYTDFTFGLNVWGFVGQHMFWQPLTYMFMHGNFQHILFNMIGLFFFGMTVERALGSKEFLLMYFFIGIFSGLFSVLVYYLTGSSSVLVGASGAIYGLLLTYAVIFPHSRIFIWGIIPVPAPLLVLIYAGIEFFSQFTSFDNVSHMTHLAGFAFAFIYIVVRMGVNPFKVWFNR